MADSNEPAVLDWIDDVADRFDAAWKSGPPPRIAAFLEDSAGYQRAALLAELVKIDLEYRWQAGERRTLDDYLCEFTELRGADGSTPDDLVLYAGKVFAQAKAERELGQLSTGPLQEAPTGPTRVRCPNCRNPVAVETATEHVTCPNCGNSFRLEPEPPAEVLSENLPRPLGRFQLLELLGRGSFGTVYKAHDPDLGRQVAIKVPRAGYFASRQEEERFLGEARSAARLTHPHIVPVHAIGREGGMPYIVSEYIQGQTLAVRLADRRPSFREAAELVVNVAQALHYAHQHGVVHRDVKPGNIMLQSAEREAESAEREAQGALRSALGAPRLTDFGLARREDASIAVTLDGQVLGTPAYMPPEQAAGEQSKVDGRSDVYSLGVVLYEMLTGEVPFRGSLRMLLHQVIHEEPRPPRKHNDRIPRDLETICLKALAKSPARRYQTAGDMTAELRRFLNGETIRSRPVSNAERLWRWCRKNPRVALLTAGVAATVIIGTSVSAYYFAQSQERAKETLFEQERTREEKRKSDRRQYVSDLRLAAPYWEAAQIQWVLNLLKGQRPENTGDIELRGFEWYYWQNRCFDSLQILPHTSAVHGQTSGVSCLAYSPDGKRLAAGVGFGNENGDDVGGEVKIWDLGTRQELVTLAGHTRKVVFVAFTHDKKRIVSVSHDGMVRIWNAETFDSEDPFRVEGGPLIGAALSADSRLLACADNAGKVTLWDLVGKQQKTEFTHHSRGARLALSSDGTQLAAAWHLVNEKGDDLPGEVTVWDLSGKRPQRDFPGHTRYVSSLAFNHDGTQLASGSRDHTVRVLDLVSNRGPVILTGHKDLIGGVAFSPDGERIATASNDFTLRIWDLKTGRERHILRGHTKGVDSVAFSPNGEQLASGSGDGTVRVWDAIRGQEPLTLEGHKKEAYSVAFNRMGDHVVTSYNDGVVKLWDIETRKEIRTFVGHNECVNCVALSPDERLIATASDDKTVRIWNAESGEELFALKDHTAPVWSVAFSLDGKRLASASKDTTVRIWDVATGRQILHIQASKGPELFCVTFSPDARLIATAGWAPTVCTWDAATGEKVRNFYEDGMHPQWSVAFSRDGKQLISAGNDGTLRLWNVDTGELIRRFRGHTAQVSRAVFSPDGKRIASAGWDGTVRLWDVDSGEEVLSLKSRKGERVFCVAFSPDGHRLASTNTDGTVQIWDATPRER